MFLLGKIRTTPKILAIVLLLNLIAAGIAAMSIAGFGDIAATAHLASLEAKRTLAASRMNQNIIGLNRIEMVIAAEPDEANINIQIPLMEQELAQFRERVQIVRTSPVEQVRKALDVTEASFAQFNASFGKIMALAKAVKGRATPEQSKALNEAAFASRALYLAVRQDVNRMVEVLLASSDSLEQNIKLQKERETSVLTMLAVVAAVIGISMSWVVGQFGIAKPLQSLNRVIGELARGNNAVEVIGIERSDEIGDIAKSVLVLRDNAKAAEDARAEREAAMAVEAATVARRADMADKFVARMEALAANFSGSSNEVAQAARNLSSTAEETARQAESVAAAADEASSNVETVAAGAEQLTSSIREINEQVIKSASIADVAAEEARSSSVNVKTLASSAEEIGAVVDLINNIASQTNLLALNATIEAARAGEAGKGFAVVASEVKGLAAQTAKATEEIARKISEMQEATHQTVSSISQIVTTISTIREITTSIAGAVEEQSAATNEIAMNTQQASAGTMSVTQNIAGVGTAAEMTGAASTQLLGLSQSLTEQSTSLQKEVQDFVIELRAA